MGLNPWDNPMKWVDPPKMARRILPSLTKQEVCMVIDNAENTRDKAIVSLFAESGLRLSEMANIHVTDIDWSHRTVRTAGKGNKVALAPFGEQSEHYLKMWLAEFQPDGSNIWGVNRWQIVVISRNLKVKSGFSLGLQSLWNSLLNKKPPSLPMPKARAIPTTATITNMRRSILIGSMIMANRPITARKARTIRARRLIAWSRGSLPV
jgi:integrase